MIMKVVKLIVLLFCALHAQSHRSGYCEICSNHTLCKYSVGPNTECRGYDRAALLTAADIVQIVTRINERRNLVATGRLNRFPQAANMRKMRWSTELAKYAQRWADQCDPSVRPNKEDACRNLVNLEVGQSIATVLGLSPGLNVRSFVDMWFIMKVHYMGSVMFYNQSRDEKTNYFTQLIWADTEYVGCGRAKFFNGDMNVIVDRLVCNFAPKGNNQGKPIYAIGYPATQCPSNMIPDPEFPGLCKRNVKIATKFTVEDSSVSTLLRILNLSNNSAKQELDPNNLKRANSNISENNDQRNQKTRHVNLDNSYSAVKRDSFHIQSAVSEGQQFTPDRGHSRVYHGYQTRKEPIHYMSTQTYPIQDMRRHESFITNNYSNRDHAHAMNHHQCTRKGKANEYGCCTIAQCVTNQCTRGQPHSCSLSPQPCDHAQNSQGLSNANHDSCACNQQTTCPTMATKCNCNSLMKCQCSGQKCPTPFQTTFCAKRRSEEHPNSKPAQFNYYDLFPSIKVRSGEFRQKYLDETDIDYPIDTPLESRNKEAEIHEQVKETGGSLQMGFGRPQDSYDIFYSSERKRRDFEDQVTFKPFWQMDEYNHKRPSELKSLRYTTLVNKRNRKTRRTTPLPTETITIKLEDEYIIHDNHRAHGTEKYLSFEELMHLRKLSTQDPLDYDARRIGDLLALRAPATTTKPTPKPAVTTKPTPKPAVTTKPTTKAAATTTKAAVTTKPAATQAKTTEATTTVITANTPFVRLKHCTRKLTCTWTGLTITGSDGNAIYPGGGLDIGSRTPPGYVDGCTRTSTCTRDFMDRNKVTSTGEVSSEESTPEDEEYCERRSLNVQRRNLDDTATFLSIKLQEAFTETPSSTLKLSHVSNRGIAKSQKILNEHSDCICYEDISRVKRGEIQNYEQILSKDCNNVIKNKNPESYVTPYYPIHSAVKAIIPKSLKCIEMSHKCLCNNSTKSIQSTFYRVILLKCSVTWIFHYLLRVYKQFLQN